jgi:ATP dependent DNA ligase domain
MLPRRLPTGFIQPCLPTKAQQPPTGDAWLHEIKHDGFRVIARKDGPRVRLYSRPGKDLTYRFPLSSKVSATSIQIANPRPVTGWICFVKPTPAPTCFLFPCLWVNCAWRSTRSDHRIEAKVIGWRRQ